MNRSKPPASGIAWRAARVVALAAAGRVALTAAPTSRPSRLLTLAPTDIPREALAANTGPIGRAVRAALEPIRPLLAASPGQPAGRVVVGTEAGNLHEIGENLVPSIFEGGGLETRQYSEQIGADGYSASGAVAEAPQLMWSRS